MLPPDCLVINSRFEHINLSAYTLRKSKYHCMTDHAKLCLFVFTSLVGKQEIMADSRSKPAVLCLEADLCRRGTFKSSTGVYS